MSELAETQQNEVLDRRSKIQNLQDVMMGMEQAELPVINHFADHLYARELHIPADTALIGEIHKTRHLNILAKGRIKIFTEQNGSEEIEAPAVMVAEPGTKRVGYTITDTVWITVHGGVESTNMDELKAQLIAPSYEALEHDEHMKLSNEEHF